MPAPLLIPLAVAGVNAAIGGYKAFKGAQALKRLGEEEYPEMELSPEVLRAQQESERMSKIGFSPEQKAAFFQNLARGNNAGFRRATQMGGGGLSKYVNAGINFGNTGALTDFAAKDSSLQQNNFQRNLSFAMQLQNMKNMFTQNKQSRRNMLEQGANQTLSSGINGIGSAIGGYGSLEALNQMYGGSMNYDANGNKYGIDRSSPTYGMNPILDTE